jgi:hypothetical protein
MYSPSPRIVLKYKDGRYRLAYDLMKRPAPTSEQFATLVQSTKDDDEWTDAAPPDCDMNCGVPVAVWGNMLELLYTGHADLAWQFFDESWRPSRRDKASFAKDFCRQLSESQYWPDLQKEIGTCLPREFHRPKK